MNGKLESGGFIPDPNILEKEKMKYLDFQTEIIKALEQAESNKDLQNENADLLLATTYYEETLEDLVDLFESLEEDEQYYKKLLALKIAIDDKIDNIIEI